MLGNRRLSLIALALMGATASLDAPTRQKPVATEPLNRAPEPEPSPQKRGKPVLDLYGRPVRALSYAPVKLPKPQPKSNHGAADRRRKRMVSTVMKHAIPTPAGWRLGDEERARLVKAGFSDEFIDATLAAATPESMILGEKGGYAVVDDCGPVPDEAWDLLSKASSAADSCEAPRADRQKIAQES